MPLIIFYLKMLYKQNLRDEEFDVPELGFKTKFNIHDGIKEMTSILESENYDLSQSNV